MNNVSCSRTALSSLWDAGWTVTSASALAVGLLAFSPTADGPAVLPEVTHPDTCRACASSSPQIKAVRDASLIKTGAIEDPTVSDHLAE
jgi:hypothetical protein